MNKKNYILAPNINNYCHGFFTKKGGVSSGIYSSLNCGLSSNDLTENVLKNRKNISAILNFNYKQLIVANQIHSNKVELIDKNSNNLKCDAMISLSYNLALGVLTADCCPILVAHKKKHIAGVIHLGWRGLYSGILENFFDKLKILNIKISDIIIALGPCIGSSSYEVSFDFKQKFLSNDIKSKIFFKNLHNKCFFDLRGYAKYKLIKLGCSNIWSSNDDTYKQNNEFFSYRYSYHNKFKDYGRMLSVIKI